ncbi:MAG: FG-GAP-like repeat-containing protein [Bacteroidales bacterium]
MKTILLYPWLILIFIITSARSQTIPYALTPDWESTAAGHYATGLALVDINGDGWKDMVVANGNDMQLQRLVVYYNNGDGTFPLLPDWQSDDIDYLGHIAAGDINKDGWVDIAVSVYIGSSGFTEPGRVKVYYNTGGELESLPSFESENFYSFSCALGDFDGDGDLDLAVATGEMYYGVSDQARVFVNRNGTFSQNADWTSTNSFSSIDVEFGDFDQNGFLDLVFIGAGTPNYIYLADNDGIIPPTPSWQSTDPNNYTNSVDFGLTGPDKTPGIVVTGNSQLGGDGKVRLYSFASGVPPSSSASWSSNPFGYGSGILLADVNDNGNPDLIYGGWWLPVKIALGTGDGFELTPSYTSATASVVEAIQMADLNRDGIASDTDTLNIEINGSSVVSLKRQLIEEILSVHLNGQWVSPAFYCYVTNKNWISFKDELLQGDELIIEYEYSTKKDMVITNWDPTKGNYIFYHTIQTGYDAEQPGNAADNFRFSMHPNPASGQFWVEFFLETREFIEIELLDFQGRKTFFSERDLYGPGNISVEINTNGLPAGIYFLDFRSASRKLNRKVVIKN